MTRAPRRRRDGRTPTIALGLCSLLLGLLTVGLAGQLPAAQGATSAPLALTTLFSTIEGPPTVTGINALPVGPTEIGTFRQAMAFTPTISGTAQLLSMRGQCVGLSCQEIGQVSIQADVNNKPSGENLGSMGFYLAEDVPNLWRISLTGNPTGGTFRLRYTDGATVKTTEPIPWNAWITCFCASEPPDEDVAAMVRAAGFPAPSFGTANQEQLPADLVRMTLSGAGTVTAVDVRLTGGTSPGVSIEQPRVDKECGSLSGAPMLTAGTKYWAVMSAPGEVAWNYWSDDPAQVLESVDDGPWAAKPGAKTPALRVDAGATTCQPVAETNPASGTKLADFVTAPGATAWTTATIGNGGVAPLTLGRARFTGGGASAFSLLNQEPGALSGPFKIPTSIGVDGLSILYVACNSAQQGFFSSTLVIDTSDPDLPSVSYPVTCLVDNTPPTVGFSSPSPNGSNGWYKTSPVNLIVTANDPESGQRLSSVVCQDDNLGGINPSSVSGRQMTSVVSGQGIHNIVCEATDQAGNHASGFTRTVKVDSQTPMIATTVTPSANGLGWHRDDATVAFVCTDAEPGSGLAQEVAGGTTVTQETAGTQITPTGCRDTAGNQATATPVTVKLDRTPPTFAAVVSPTPNAAGWNASLPVTISFPCSDTGPVQSGTTGSPASATLNAETSQQIYTRDASACTDRASNPASQGVIATVRVDVTAPTTTMVSAPSGFTSSTSATFTYAGSDNRSGVAGFECSLDDAAYVSCPSGQSYDGLGEGPHTVRVRAVDVAGNVDASPELASWTVDIGAPSTQLTDQPPALTNQSAASFAYTGTDTGTSVTGFECRLDDAPFGACPDDEAEYDGLAQGAHTFDVRAVDAAGNRDPDPAHWAWTVDLTAPTTTITAAPARRTPDDTATFEFDAMDSGGGAVAGRECRLDGAAFAPCTSPHTLSGLDLGEHTFDVRATDTAGNVGETVTRTWSVLEFFVEDDGAQTHEDVAVTVPITVNDVSPSGADVTLHPASSAAGGTVVVQGDALRYSPPPDFYGTDTFTYTASNAGVTTDPATVTVRVLPVNDAPRFTPGGPVTVVEDSGAHTAGWATDVGPGPGEGGQPVHFVLDELSDPALFAVPPSLGADGVLRFTPAPEATGTATVRARLVDDGGTADGGTDTSDPAVLQIQITAQDDTPSIEVLPRLRTRGDRAWLRVRVGDLDSVGLTVQAHASADGLAVTPSGTGEVRTIRLRGLLAGAHGRLVLRVSDGSSAASTTLRLRVGSPTTDTITGTSGADLILSRGGDDRVRGLGGDDLVAGGNGADRLVGGRGDDVLRGGPGDDVLLGGPGSNTIIQRSLARGL